MSRPVFFQIVLVQAHPWRVRAKHSSMLRSSTLTTSAFTIRLRKVRSSFARRLPYFGLLIEGIKQLQKALVRKVAWAFSCIRSIFERADVSVQLVRTAKLRCMNYVFFNTKKEMPKPLLAQKIVFFSKAVLDNLRRKPRKESNFTGYQPMRRKNSTFSAERKIHPRRAGTMAVCRKTDICQLLMSTL